MDEFDFLDDQRAVAEVTLLVAAIDEDGGRADDETTAPAGRPGASRISNPRAARG